MTRPGLAALTIASTRIVVISSWTMLKGMALPPLRLRSPILPQPRQYLPAVPRGRAQTEHEDRLRKE
jgi:hypothetical protein